MKHTALLLVPGTSCPEPNDYWCLGACREGMQAGTDAELQSRGFLGPPYPCTPLQPLSLSLPAVSTCACAARSDSNPAPPLPCPPCPSGTEKLFSTLTPAFSFPLERTAVNGSGVSCLSDNPWPSSGTGVQWDRCAAWTWVEALHTGSDTVEIVAAGFPCRWLWVSCVPPAIKGPA